MGDKKLTLTVDIDSINTDAITLIDKLRISVERLLGEIEEAEINISYMHAYKPLVKILDECDAYDRNIKAMGICRRGFVDMDNNKHDYLPFTKEKADSMFNSMQEILSKTNDLTVASIMLRGLVNLRHEISTYIIDEQRRELKQ